MEIRLTMIKNPIGVLEREANNDNRLVKPITAMATFINRANESQAKLFSSKEYLTVFKAGRGIGKAEPIHSLIPTPSGLREMGDLSIGDEVYSEKGNRVKITGIYPQGVRRCMRVQFRTGYAIVDEEHLWQANIGYKSKRGDYTRKANSKVLTTKQMYDDIKEGKKCYWIPILSEPTENTDKDYYIKPYSLGALIGDGTLTNGVSITTADEEMIDKMRDELPEGLRINKLVHKYGYSITSDEWKNPYKREIERLGLNCLSYYKYIPNEYLIGSVEQRIELLRGLMDTDGYISDKGTITYCTVSRRLADDIKQLVSGLGGTCSIYMKRPKNGDKVFHAYECYIRIRQNPFYLPRKAIKFKITPSYPTHRRILNITPTVPQECQCISVDNPTHLYCTGRDHFITHNSLLLSYIMAEFLISTKRRNIILIAPTITDAHTTLIDSEASGLAFFFDIHNKHLFKYDRQYNYIVYLPTMSKIFIFGATGEDKVRGKNADMVICDEFAMYQQPGIIAQAEFTLRQKTKAGEVRIKRLILASTPKNNETTKLYVRKAKDKGILVEGTTFTNRDNLDEDVLREFTSSYKEGSKLYLQELMGEVVTNLDSAIATAKQIQDGRKDKPLPIKDYDEIVISIDPAVSSNTKNADTGIIVAGIHMPECEIKNKLEGKAYNKHVDVLQDASTHGSPEVWLKAVNDMWAKWGKPLIIVEKNQGGNLLKQALLGYNQEFKVREHTATKSKAERLMPLAGAYLQGEMHHIGFWAELEDQAQYFDPDDKGMRKDRIDALGHAFNYLRGKKVARVIDLYPDSD